MLFTIWCKLCEFTNAVLLLCQGISTLSTNLTCISNQNVIIKDKVVAIVGDPDAECPDCPPPSEGIIAQQEVTQALVGVTENMLSQTTAIKAKATAIKSALRGSETEERKEETPADPLVDDARVEAADTREETDEPTADNPGGISNRLNNLRANQRRSD